jgi:hypothetical protein
MPEQNNQKNLPYWLRYTPASDLSGYEEKRERLDDGRRYRLCFRADLIK